MHFKVYLLLYTHIFFIHYSNAFNITAILNQYPTFSRFNRYLSETNLTTEINSQQSVTVLAVPNDVVSRLFGEPLDVLKNIIRVHVVRGYYDIQKLRKLTNKTFQMTTLFQTTGQAPELQGFLKATVLKNGNVFIGSASQGSPLGAILVRSIACETCNISVLHISTVIVPVRKFCSVLAPGSDSNSPVEPPDLSPKAVPPLAPRTGPSHSTTPPPFPNTPMTTPSESPVDAPEYSRESPPNPIDTPSRSPPDIEDAPTRPPPQPADTNTDSGTSNIRSGLDVVIIIVLLSSIYLIVQI